MDRYSLVFYHTASITINFSFYTPKYQPLLEQYCQWCSSSVTNEVHANINYFYALFNYVAVLL